MPIIPTMTPGGDVRNNVSPDIQVSSDAFGGANARMLSQVGQTGEQLGNQVFNDAARAQMWQEQMRVRDAVTQYQQQTMDDVQTKLLTKQGKEVDAGVDANGNPTPNLMGQAQSIYDGNKQTVLDTLQSPREKAMASRYMDQQNNHFNSLVVRHYTGQMQWANQQSLMSAAGTNLDLLTADPVNPINYQNSKSTALALTNQMYQGKVDAPTLAEKQQDATNLVASKSIQAVADNDPTTALQLLEARKGDMQPLAYQGLLAQVKKQALVQDAQNLHDQLKDAPADVQAQSLDKADPKVAAIASPMLQLANQQKAYAAQKATADTNIPVVQGIVNDPANAAQYIPKGADPDVVTHLTTMASQFAQKPPVTDAATYSSLLKMANSDPKSFLAQDLTQSMDKLSPDAMNTLIGLRQGLDKKDPATVQKVADLAGQDKLINEAIEKSPFAEALVTKKVQPDPTKPPTYVDGSGKALSPDEYVKQQQDTEDFKQAVHDEIAAKVGPDGKAPPPSVVNDIINKEMAKQVVQRGTGWFGMRDPSKDKFLPAGYVALHPELDQTVPVALRGRPNIEKGTVDDGTGKPTDGYIQRNQAGKPIASYDGNGKLILIPQGK